MLMEYIQRDPKVDKNAVKYEHEHLTHIQMLQEGLPMDSTASSFCMDNIPLNVFSIMEEGNIKRAAVKNRYVNN